MKAIALEQAQHEALNGGDVALAEPGGGMEPQLPGSALADDAVDDTDVEVQMRILPFGHTSAEPTRWQGLFLQSYCIPAIAHGRAGAAKHMECARAAIHGGQMKVTAPKRTRPAPGPGARSNAIVGIDLNPITESSLKRNASEARCLSA